MTVNGSRPRLFLVSGLVVLALNLASSSRADDLSATEWSAKVDPPAKALAKPTVKEFAIPFPGNFGSGGDAVYPSTPSSFVAIGKNAFDNDVRQVWDLSTKKQVGAVKGQIGFDDKTVALSSDGAYLAGKPTFRKTVEVRATKNGRVAQSFDVDSPFIDFVDFAAGDRVIFGRLQDRKLQVADIKSGDKVCDVNLEKEADREAVAISPGRAYLAAVSWNDGTLRVYSLADGKVVGEAPTPKKNGQNVRCFGLAYSADGGELAGLFEYFGEYRVVCWSAADGKMLADFDLGKEIQRPTFYKDRGIDYFPDKSAWLVLGYAVVDREAGKKVWNLPFDNANLKVSPRRFLDDDHALVVSFAPSMSLRTAAVPRDKIAGAARIVRSGGNAADASLPPLKAADLASAKRVELNGKAGAWTAAADPAAIPAKRLTSRPITLKGKADEMRSVLFAGNDSSLAIVVATPTQPGQDRAAEGQPRWVERFDLATGKGLGKVDLPPVVDPIALSPDGASLLLRETRAQDRLDLFTADGKPVVGWRPYEKESGEEKAVIWAGFLDAGRVLTLSKGGTLILWSVPACKAVYIAEDAFVGPPALGPGRKLVAGFDGKTVRVLDAETGAPKGEGTAPTGLGPRAEWKQAAFRPDGQQLAAQFANGSVFCWDLKTGKIATEFRPAVPLPGNGIEWAGPTHLLIDNHSLIDLGTRRSVWEYLGSPVGGCGPDGRHWFVGRGAPGQESGVLVALTAPDPACETAESLLADPKALAVIRPGSRVGIQLNLSGPPRDPQGFRQGLTEALAAKLKANGLIVVEDGVPTGRPGSSRVSYVVRPVALRAAAPDVRLVLNVTEKDTGRTITYQGMGRGRGNVQVVKLIDLACEMTVVDATGSVPCGMGYTSHMQPFGFVLRLPAGETDPEQYLKKLQWDRVKLWATNPGPPYFIARDGNNTVRLPGSTDLNNPAAR